MSDAKPAPDGLGLTSLVARSLSLRENLSWTFLGNIVYGLCQWGMLIALTKFTTSDQVGQFSLGLALTAPIIIATNLNLRTVQATDAHQTYHFGHYLSLRLATTLLAAAITVLVVLVIGYTQATALIILGVGLAKLIEAVSDIYFGLFQRHERMDRVAWSMILKGGISLVLLGAAAYLTHEVRWGVAALIFAWLLILVTYDIPNGVRLLKDTQAEPGNRALWQWRNVVRLAWSTSPLAVSALLSSLAPNIPNYLIVDVRELGIFNALAYLMIAGARLMVSVAQSTVAGMARHFAAGNFRAYRKLLLQLLGVGCFIGLVTVVVAIAIGKPILTLIYTSEYAAHSDVFIWLMVVAALDYIVLFLEYSLTALRQYWIQMPLMITANVVMLAGCIFFIPRLGMMGAALAMLLSVSVELVIAAAINVRVLRRLARGLA